MQSQASQSERINTAPIALVGRGRCQRLVVDVGGMQRPGVRQQVTA